MWVVGFFLIDGRSITESNGSLKVLLSQSQSSISLKVTPACFTVSHLRHPPQKSAAARPCSCYCVLRVCDESLPVVSRNVLFQYLSDTLMILKPYSQLSSLYDCFIVCCLPIRNNELF